jgi:U3 small nucleolar RNA-associated protein 20
MTLKNISLDENSGKIHLDHRQQLLPILMRILYGKFHSHESTHTSSKDTKSNKRGIIIQFLSSCNESELYYFFDLLFGCVTSIFKESQNELQLQALQNKLNDYNGDGTLYTLNSIIPIKKLLGVLDSLEIVIKKLARRMENFSHCLLKILCFIHKYVYTLHEIGTGSIVLEKTKTKISEYHMNLFRIIRQKVTLRFKQVIKYL